MRIAPYILSALLLIASLSKGSADDVSAASKPEAPIRSIYGRIQIVTTNPDYKVEVVNSFEDLRVQKVDAFPDSTGKWQLVDSFPDYKIQIVKAFGDFKVKWVSSFPGIARD